MHWIDGKMDHEERACRHLIERGWVAWKDRAPGAEFKRMVAQILDKRAGRPMRLIEIRTLNDGLVLLAEPMEDFHLRASYGQNR